MGFLRFGTGCYGQPCPRYVPRSAYDGHHARGAERPRLPRRAQARAAVVRQVPAAGRPPGASAGSGPPGPSAGGRRPATSRSARRTPGCATCSTRHATARWRDRSGPVCRSRRRPRSSCATSSTTARASRRRSSAIERSSGPSCSPCSAMSRSSRSRADDRTLALRRRPLVEHAHEVARPASRHLPARAQAPWTAGQSRRRRRQAVAAPQRRHRGLLARGGDGAGPGRVVRAGRGDLPHRRLHRPSPACAVASCWRCAGATSTSPAR